MFCQTEYLAQSYSPFLSAQVMAALSEAKGAAKDQGKGGKGGNKGPGGPSSEENSDIYKIIRMIMQREFDPVRARQNHEVAMAIIMLGHSLQASILEAPTFPEGHTGPAI